MYRPSQTPHLGLSSNRIPVRSVSLPKTRPRRQATAQTSEQTRSGEGGKQPRRAQLPRRAATETTSEAKCASTRRFHLLAGRSRRVQGSENTGLGQAFEGRGRRGRNGQRVGRAHGRRSVARQTRQGAGSHDTLAGAQRRRPSHQKTVRLG
jgi:hypothetical protein